ARRPCRAGGPSHSRRPPQSCSPVLQLLLQLLPLQPFPLPQRIIPILHFQLRQPSRLSFAIPGIQLHHLTQQHSQRPPVRHDAVHRHHHHMLSLPHPPHPHPPH